MQKIFIRQKVSVRTKEQHETKSKPVTPF